MKYRVTIEETEIYVFEVEATNEKSAHDKAFEILDNETKENYHSDSKASATANRI